MARNGVDFTLIFRRLCDAATGPDGDAAMRNLFTDPSSFDDWAVRWRHRLAEEGGEANERRTAMRRKKYPPFGAGNARNDSCAQRGGQEALRDCHLVHLRVRKNSKFAALEPCENRVNPGHFALDVIYNHRVHG